MSLSSSTKKAVISSLLTLSHVGTRTLKSATKTSAKIALMSLIDPQLAGTLKKLASGGSLQFSKEEIKAVSDSVGLLKYSLLKDEIILGNVIGRAGDDVIFIQLTINNKTLLRKIDTQFSFTTTLDSVKFALCLYKEHKSQHNTSREIIPPVLEILKKDFTINAKLSYLPNYPRFSGEKNILDNLVDNSPTFSYFIKVSSVADAAAAKLNNVLLKDRQNKSTKLDAGIARVKILSPALEKIRDYITGRITGKPIKNPDTKNFTDKEIKAVKTIVKSHRDDLAKYGIELTEVIDDKEVLNVRLVIDSTSASYIKLSNKITPPRTLDTDKFSLVMYKDQVKTNSGEIGFIIRVNLMYLDRFPSIIGGVKIIKDVLPKTASSPIYITSNPMSETSVKNFILIPSLNAVINFLS